MRKVPFICPRGRYLKDVKSLRIRRGIEDMAGHKTPNRGEKTPSDLLHLPFPFTHGVQVIIQEVATEIRTARNQTQDRTA